MEKMIIIDTLEPKMKLSEVLDFNPEKRIDRLIGEVIEGAKDFENEYTKKRDGKRREKLNDSSMINKLEILISGIDTSAMSEKELIYHKTILAKY